MVQSHDPVAQRQKHVFTQDSNALYAVFAADTLSPCPASDLGRNRMVLGRYLMAIIGADWIVSAMSSEEYLMQVPRRAAQPALI